MQAKSSKQVEVPFKTKLFTGQAEDALTVICSVNSPTDFWALEHQVGGGNATHLGNFTTDLKFCFHVVFDEQGNPDPEGGFGEYGTVEGYMEAANGDRLFVTTPGSILIPIQDDFYAFKFEDICIIGGGTGRFENASGELNINSRVRIDGTGTDHKWEGTIFLK
ncbi:hypothetical protein GSB9_02503 [Flavobacteriaceae bacterium GSB9]|nr:hypothetical protein GSB9_02503 [Flavobacteriaceae bacterium GSB9]